MKIQCDVCGIEQASVFCCADEAVLCSGCDCRIHSANKLAGKHRRFSLLLPSPPPLPLCDICKEKNGFVFCQEDRAILCRDCDVPIHSVNVHAGRHSRFLLTGIRLSSSPIPSSELDQVYSNGAKSRVAEEKPACRAAVTKPKEDGGGGGGGGSNITDYLTKMLPGWRVDDFLFDEPAADEKDAFGGVWKVHGAHQPAAHAGWFTPASVNATAEAVAAPEMQWRPVMSSEEGSRARWSEEEASMVPELSQFNCNYRNNKRTRTSLWF